MTDLDPALRHTEAARSPSRLLALGLPDDSLTPEELADALPQYDQFERIGAGGMGVVWSARQIRLDRRVAIKFLRPELATDPSFAERFDREARALAKLQHPGIVAIHDYGEAMGMCFLVMEYVDGTDLRSVMRSGISSDQALAIVPQICEALQYAHDEGVVHRDVKPENILVDRRGRVKIADFGLATLRDGDGVAQTSGRVLGTPHYMAPEQLDAPTSIDHRADIFALGVVIYEMLTGKLPVGRFSPPSALQPVDVRLDEVVLRSLEHDRERRYQHASEVRDRVVAIGPKHEHVRPDEVELERRIAVDQRFDSRVFSVLLVTFLVDALATGLWWDEHGFGYRPDLRWIPTWGYFLAAWLVHMVRLNVRHRRDRDTRLGHALMARIWAAVVLSFLGLAVVITPSQGRYLMVIFAAIAAYRTWVEAVRHHIPARIVLGPSWWIHRWAADAEHGR